MYNFEECDRWHQHRAEAADVDPDVPKNTKDVRQRRVQRRTTERTTSRAEIKQPGGVFTQVRANKWKEESAATSPRRFKLPAMSSGEHHHIYITIIPSSVKFIMGLRAVQLQNLKD